MVINVNFGNADSVLPSDEFILDSGAGFSEEQGFGWVTEASLNDAVATPLDLSTNTRERDANDDQSIDTLIHLQFPTGLTGARAEGSITTPGAWEYVLANGTYQVRVGVGDALFTDSNHVINVEGQNLISGFAPSESELFTEATATVEVTDGRLTIDAIGGENTKLNFVEIVAEDTIDGATPEDNTDTDIPTEEGTPENTIDTDMVDTEDSNISATISETILDEPVTFNFGTSVISSPGDIQILGEAFSEETGFGFITQDSVGSDSPVPLDIRGNSRDRNSIAEAELDSLIHLQFSEEFTQPNSITTPAAWELELANGEYVVTVAVGDPDFTDSNHVINIEGSNVISGFTPTEDQLFEIATTTVEVTDGRLTIDAIGGENTKINFVEVALADDTPIETSPIEIPTTTDIPVDPATVVEPIEPVPGAINVNFGVPVFGSPAGFTSDIGEAFSDEQGFGWVTEASAGTSDPVGISVIANGRDRNSLFNDGEGNLFNDPVLDSLIHLQFPTGLPNSDTAVTTPVAWEFALDNGQYEVTVGAGDSDFFDSNHVINVEGVNLISGFIPTGSNGASPIGAEAFTTGSAVVEVEDGRLTVDAIGGENTKINFISIVPVDAV